MHHFNDQWKSPAKCVPAQAANICRRANTHVGAVAQKKCKNKRFEKELQVKHVVTDREPGSHVAKKRFNKSQWP